MTDCIVVKAPAKLNLTLEVVARLPTGYHNIRSVFVRLDNLADTIELRLDPTRSGIAISTNSDEIPLDATNICHQAAAQYVDQIGAAVRVEIHIDKKIPVAAGLGGGSSDAAAVLLALNRHFDNGVSTDDLSAIGSRVGKDLPFFLTETNAAYVSGMGEINEPLGRLPPVRFLIVNPGFAVSTQQAYQALAQNVWFMSHNKRANVSRAMAQAIAAGDVAAIAATLYNDFESLLERDHPIIKEIKQVLVAFGAIGALMSGSGPTVFGLFGSDSELLIAEEVIKRHYPALVVTRA